MKIKIVGCPKLTEEYRAMIKVLRACEAAGISPPEEASDFFARWDKNNPDVELRDSFGVALWADEQEEGYEISLDYLPKSIGHIRVTIPKKASEK